MTDPQETQDSQVQSVTIRGWNIEYEFLTVEDALKAKSDRLVLLECALNRVKRASGPGGTGSKRRMPIGVMQALMARMQA